MDHSRMSAAIGSCIGRDLAGAQWSPVGGGCINQGWRLDHGQQTWFVKTNRAEFAEMFAAEADGLRELAEARAVRVPAVVSEGIVGRDCYLCLEWMVFGRGTADSARALGRQLAGQHRQTAERFGWHRDNTIGRTPQPNRWTGDWPTFYGVQRLGFQINLLLQRDPSGFHAGRADRLCHELRGFFTDYVPEPALLHGDLWGGNQASLADGTPVIFDPAVYYGDREADLAMTELFGGFPPDFYAAYNEEWPLDAGYGVRRDLYNLYHILNHANLFGGGYAAQADDMIRRLLAELGG